MAVEVSKKVKDGLDKIRKSGETNMFDYNRVMEIANERDMYAVVSWLYDNKDKYLEGVLEGFKIKE